MFFIIWYDVFSNDDEASLGFRKHLEKAEIGTGNIKYFGCLSGYPTEPIKKDKLFYIGFPTVKGFKELIDEINNTFNNIKIEIVDSLNASSYRTDDCWSHPKFYCFREPPEGKKIQDCEIILYKYIFSPKYSEKSKWYLGYALSALIRSFAWENLNRHISEASSNFIERALQIGCRNSCHNFSNTVITIEELKQFDNVKRVNSNIESIIEPLKVPTYIGQSKIVNYLLKGN
jgi:hypothetical protein